LLHIKWFEDELIVKIWSSGLFPFVIRPRRGARSVLCGIRCFSKGYHASYPSEREAVCFKSQSTFRILILRQNSWGFCWLRCRHNWGLVTLSCRLRWCTLCRTPVCAWDTKTITLTVPSIPVVWLWVIPQQGEAASWQILSESGN
jgi:hypothetical protein